MSRSPSPTAAEGPPLQPQLNGKLCERASADGDAAAGPQPLPQLEQKTNPNSPDTDVPDDQEALFSPDWNWGGCGDSEEDTDDAEAPFSPDRNLGRSDSEEDTDGEEAPAAAPPIIDDSDF